MRIQSADSFDDTGESAPSCGGQTTHSPFSSIAGSKTARASFCSIWIGNPSRLYHRIATKRHKIHKRAFVNLCVFVARLLLMSLHVIDRECLQGRGCESQVGRLCHCPINVPLINERPLDEPHRSSAI